ncbi:MAG TPA: helix-turn-helix domain-containing protein [Patescibacteria group bacterium]|nr:helix-turn-helix domain-containing protein [Patescibacteria group bacterium]
MVKLGQLLRQQRLRKKLTLEEVAQGTRIKETFLAALERGEYNKLPSPAYAKGFVTNYATFLGLPRSEVLAIFRREFDEKKAVKVLPDSFANRQQFSGFRIKIQESLLIIIGLVVVFLGFLAFQYRAAFIAPPLTVLSPEDEARVSQAVVVSGRTDSEASVTVNNEPVSLDTKGEFIKHLTFFPGEVEIVVKAKNRFGKENTVVRKVTVE